MHRLRGSVALLITIVSFCAASYGRPATDASALERLPVKEVTVFKDGHTLVLHSGTMATDEAGNVTIDYLPSPVLGTFWPFSADKDAKLVATLAGQKRVSLTRTALNLRELIEANVGAAVIVTELPPPGANPSALLKYDATILSIPEQSADELAATAPPNSPARLAQKGNIVLLKADSGVKVVSFDRIVDITFKSDHQTKVQSEEFRSLLTLQLDWKGGKSKQSADVGMMYVQKGIRWIPNYKISVDGNGTATVRLQATLLNELTDLNDVTVNLVIGVPTFAFKDTNDPVGLQQAIAQLSPYFQQNAQTAYALSNAIMTQAGARMSERVAPDPGAVASPAPPDLGPELSSAGKSEDLFVFTVKHISLKKGQRLVVPVTEFTLPYKDVYTLELPFLPPPEVMRGFDSSRQAELARLFSAPKPVHKIRLTNKSAYPLTTAPALILRGENLLAQGMMTYTPIGSESDLEITTAVDIRVAKSEHEIHRIPDAANFDGNSFFRIDLAGSITLTNFSSKPAEIEIRRYVFGETDSADHDGKFDALNGLEDSELGAWAQNAQYPQYPYWWSWYAWPYWWRHFNPVGRISWDVKLEPNKPVELKYEWHYFWR